MFVDNVLKKLILIVKNHPQLISAAAFEDKKCKL
jgi:hypothetical protein